MGLKRMSPRGIFKAEGLLGPACWAQTMREGSCGLGGREGKREGGEGRGGEGRGGEGRGGEGIGGESLHVAEDSGAVRFPIGPRTVAQTHPRHHHIV